METFIIVASVIGGVVSLGAFIVLIAYFAALGRGMSR